LKGEWLTYKTWHFSVQEAVRREVLEEAGLEFEPEAVIALEHNSHGYWIRVTFAGTSKYYQDNL